MANRWRWLGRWWFLGAVALLALNDQVLKARHPGWWTGKASDVAGVAVVGVLASVLVGRRAGLAGTALAFAALKTVPGVAELAAPFLGGVTRRDATDLLGLVALAPLWPLLAEPATVRPPTHPQPDRPVRRPHRPDARPSGTIRRAAAGFFPVLGALTAVVATTATSCVSPPIVTQVAASGDVVYARMGNTSPWARSDDGGRTWRKAEAPSAALAEQLDIDVVTTTTGSTTTVVPTTGVTTTLADSATLDDGELGPLRDCGPDGCVRAVDRTLERTTSPSGEGGWAREYDPTPSEYQAISTGCSDRHTGVLTSVAVTSAPGGAVASLGANGVLVRQPDGTWETRAVLGADQGEPGAPITGSLWFWAVVALAPLGVAAAWRVSQPGSVGRWVASAVVPLGIAAVLVVQPLAPFATERPPYGFGHLAVGLVVVVVGLGIARTGRRAPIDPWDHRPPPPVRLPPPPRP